MMVLGDDSELRKAMAVLLMDATRANETTFLMTSTLVRAGYYGCDTLFLLTVEKYNVLILID